MADETPHFDISAAVVRQLGDELVSDEVTAIVELVKNAYDADADYAHVVVNTKSGPDLGNTHFPEAVGYITVEDNGMGMDRSDITGGWLVISLSKKRIAKAKNQTTPKGRTPLGDKGLGRLSTQKLGHNLEMVTRKDGTDDTLHVAFSWRSFTEGKNLGEVPVTIDSAAAPRKKGTVLVISDLRNPAVWQGTARDNLAKNLAQIVSPFEQARPFLVTLEIDGVEIDLGGISAQTRKAAAATFNIDFVGERLALTGKIKLSKFRGNQSGDELAFFEKRVTPNRGRDFFEYLKEKSPPLEMSYSDDKAYFVTIRHEFDLSSLGGLALVDEAPANPGPFHAEIDEYVLRGPDAQIEIKDLPGITTISELVKRHAGIKVFRDGFGVKPYGINGEDWLRLGEGQTSGTSFYGLRPHNVIGFVAISEATNSQLKEKTDREGFVSGPYSNNFTLLLNQATKSIGHFYEWIRRAYLAYRADEISTAAPFESGQAALTDAKTVAGTISRYSDRARAMEASSSEIRAKVAALTDRISSQPLLSSPEERRLLGLLEEARAALDAAQKLGSDIAEYAAEAEQLSSVVQVLGPRLDVMNQQLADFSELAGLGLVAEGMSHEIYHLTDRLSARARSAGDKARGSAPPNVDLLAFTGEVIGLANAMRRQLGHLGPSMRYQREKIERFTASSFVEDMKSYFLDRWEEKDFGFEVDLKSDFAMRANPGRLTQVTDNLLLNAEYWLDQERLVAGNKALSVEVEIDAPFIRIGDTGRGIDVAVESTLFQPFVTLKPGKIGRGLGLFIATQIMEAMGCGITLMHVRNDAGRRYIFELDLSGIIDGS
jgi:signal transduction histidine kinase